MKYALTLLPALLLAPQGELHAAVPGAKRRMMWTYSDGGGKLTVVFGTKKEMNMKRFVMTFAILALVSNVLAGGGSNLVSNLKAGKQQTLVVYGTSLTAGGAWVGQLQKALNAQYPGQATLINSGKGSMWSKWGADNLDTCVIQKNPDTVLIEFAINDAYLDYKASVAAARSNLTNMIARILASKPETEIILMTMNPPIGIHLERRPKVKDYYQMYRDVAKERNLLLIDHYAIWEPIMEKEKALFDKYVPDGIHPGPEGCTRVITPAILKGLGIKSETTAGGDGKPAPQP